MPPPAQAPADTTQAPLKEDEDKPSPPSEPQRAEVKSDGSSCWKIGCGIYWYCCCCCTIMWVVIGVVLWGMNVELLYFKAKLDWGTMIDADDKAFPGLVKTEIITAHKRQGSDKAFTETEYNQLTDKYVEMEDKEWTIWSHGFSCHGAVVGTFYDPSGLDAAFDALFSGGGEDDSDEKKIESFQDFCVDWAKDGRTKAEANHAKR